jgi:membrane-associated protease RseP (regulator of RpoE activity)
MVISKKTIAVTAMVLLCAPVMAQEEAELEEQMRQAEARLVDQAAAEADHAEMREGEALQRAEIREKRAQYEVRMRDAEQRMAEAARQVADLSMAQLPRMERLERIIRASRGPMLGVTIGTDDNDDPVEGVQLQGVSPGGAAEEAGLRSGDVITSINDEALTADNSHDANSRLLDFMQGVEEGDVLSVEYLRDGKSASAEITPRPMGSNVFSFDFNADGFPVPPNVHVAPNVQQFRNFIWHSDGDGFGAMELAQLSERLGSYFGTDEGLLVVSAPENEDLQLEDGDVILSIDGRRPTSIAHAMRILGSYESGEELEVEIMRDKRKRTISLEIPDNRRSFNGTATAPRVPMAPVAPTAPHEVVYKEVIVVDEDRI